MESIRTLIEFSALGIELLAVAIIVLTSVDSCEKRFLDDFSMVRRHVCLLLGPYWTKGQYPRATLLV